MATTDSVARIIALSAMGGGGVSEVDYSKATNKPRINGNELVGDKTSTDLGLASIEAISNVVYEPSTGIMTFEKENGTSFNIDLPLELLIKSGSYDATTKEILLELANGDVIRINVGDLVDTYFGDEETIELFQEGGENKFRVKETVLTKIYDELNKRLKYKGHVNSKEDLPTAGQASGEVIEPSLTLTVSQKNALETGGYTTEMRNAFCSADDGWNYIAVRDQYDSTAYAAGGVVTHHPEIIDGVNFGKCKNFDTGKNIPIMILHVNASKAKPATFKQFRFPSGNYSTSVNYDDGTTESYSVTQSSVISVKLEKPCWVTTRPPLLLSDIDSSSYSYTSGRIYGSKTVGELRYKHCPYSEIVVETSKDSFPRVDETGSQSIIMPNFTYNVGYKVLTFANQTSDRDDFQWITTTESDIVENDVYTVGANYDLVRGNAVEQKWEQLAPKSIEIDNNTIALSSENKIQTRAIIDKNTNNANSFWTGTKAEYDALGVYDENTFYAITDEASEMQSALTEVSGYDAAKTQILKNINGTLTWVDSQ